MEYRGKKCLIAYFSHAGMNYVSGKIVDLKIGNTEHAAKMIGRMTGGDLFHIRAAAVYPHDYRETVSIARTEWETRTRPALSRDMDDIRAYDIVFLGYPNWCGTMPMAMWTFLEHHDFSGKTIYPFCTHEGSGVGRSLEDIHELCPKAKLGTHLVILGSTVQDAEDDVRRWLNE